MSADDLFHSAGFLTVFHSGNKFDDEWGVNGDTFIKHSVPGLLSMANSGRNTKYVSKIFCHGLFPLIPTTS